MKRAFAFTLTELLIALAILGVIATFTIPKILQSQQTQKYNTLAKEAMATVSGVYQAYRVSNTVSASTRFMQMTQYLNYVSLDTSRQIDHKQTLTSLTCGTDVTCFVLHNGGVLGVNDSPLGGTATTNAMDFIFDPNGTYGNTTDGPDKSVNFFLYTDGRIVTRGTSLPNTYINTGLYASPVPAYDPPWFSWD